jgi:hypothetical protein
MTAMEAANPVLDAESKPSERRPAAPAAHPGACPGHLPRSSAPALAPALPPYLSRTARDRGPGGPGRPERFSRYAHGMRCETARREAES